MQRKEINTKLNTIAHLGIDDFWHVDMSSVKKKKKSIAISSTRQTKRFRVKVTQLSLFNQIY